MTPRAVPRPRHLQARSGQVQDQQPPTQVQPPVQEQPPAQVQPPTRRWSQQGWFWHVQDQPPPAPLPLHRLL